MTTNLQSTRIDYKGKTVAANKLTIASEIQIPADVAWEKVQTSALLHFIAKGKIRFKPTQGHFPQKWTQGQTVSTRMFLYNSLPMGGIHSIHFEKIDPVGRIIQTREWDSCAKVWDHTISIKQVTDTSILYQDEITIYAGIWTKWVTAWAKSFYRHRQGRWQQVGWSSTGCQ
ncbi:hypothetical protein [Flavobacterium sp.]|uniref:hypothetical protein n=1 Tax=Flavobacterium sp. TaxID=239 RepID=UPI0039E6F35A